MPASSPLPVEALRSALLAFYDARARDLPWRENTDPYRVLVSEVMLQQTRVETVVPYYRRWLERFPRIEALARASEEEVLRAWQGLGYYRRARNLHGAAREVVAEHGGVLPSTVRELEALPGVGAYTAGAVASIAFGAPVPAVDGNVRRVLARVLDDPAPTPSRLRQVAGAWVDPERPGDFNQALMELGATLCTPRNPRCGACPLAGWCRARGAGRPEERPLPTPRRAVPRSTEGVAVVVAGGEVLLRKRPARGLLGGMWECPGVAVEGAPPGEGEVVARVRELASHLLGGADPGSPFLLEPVEHLFTHRRIDYHPFLFTPSSPRAELPPGHGWVSIGDPSEVPLPRAQLRVLAQARRAVEGREPG